MRDRKLEYVVDVEVAEDAARGCLLRLVSVVHARGVEVRSLHYVDEPGECRSVSVTFEASPSRAYLLQESLRRCVEVIRVDQARPAR